MKKTNRLVTVEEAWPVCSASARRSAPGSSSEAFDDLDAPPAKVSGADVPMPYAANLEKLALPSVDKVVEAVQVRLLPEVTHMAEAAMSWKKGSCHCGAMRFEVLAPDEIAAAECNCSICRNDRLSCI